MINAICHLCRNPVWDLPDDHPDTILCGECQQELQGQPDTDTAGQKNIRKCLLERARQIGALKRGEYTLRNGSMTDTYFDGRMLTMDPCAANLIGQLILPMIRAAGAQAVGGPAVSAVPIATAVSMKSWTESLKNPSEKPIPAFTVRTEPKDHGTKKLIDGPIPRRSRVALVDDTMTTGRSLQEAMTALRKDYHSICAVIVLVDRRESYDEANLIRRWAQGFTSVMDIEEVVQPISV